MSQEVVIVGGARTPMAEYVGAFKDVSALELGAHATRAALERGGPRAGLEPGAPRAVSRG